MHPILFRFFGIPLYAYGAMVALAFLCGLALIAYRARQAGEAFEPYLEAMTWFIIAGIGGARLFYLIWYPSVFFRHPLQILFNQGGLVWYGGVVGVVLAAILYTRAKQLDFFHFADQVAPAAALGLAIGRIGCFLAGCCYGTVTHLPWAVRYPLTHETHGLPVHPTPLYETALMLLVMGVLMRLDARKPFEGFTLGCFFILAGIVRFLLEYVRGDRLVWLANLDLSASQLVSLAGVLVGVGILCWLALQRKTGRAL